MSSAYKWLSETELCRCYIILSTSLPIAHWGKLCVGVFEIICERFLKCYHHLGNGWHCPEKIFQGIFVLDKRKIVFYYIVFIFRGLCLYFTRHLIPLLKHFFKDVCWTWTENDSKCTFMARQNSHSYPSDYTITFNSFFYDLISLFIR